MRILILVVIFLNMWLLGIIAALILVSIYTTFFWNKTEEAKVPCAVILIIGAVLAAIVFFINFDWMNETIITILRELKEAD
ncbi:MAG: hypothetical protein E7259_09965 [Lachnospiraceae bacterium]|nr:hypothetical protein [Lachnospiraceae bacterium]